MSVSRSTTEVSLFVSRFESCQIFKSFLLPFFLSKPSLPRRPLFFVGQKEKAVGQKAGFVDSKSGEVGRLVVGG